MTTDDTCEDDNIVYDDLDRELDKFFDWDDWE